MIILVNDSPLDLLPDSVISTTIQRLDIAQLSTRYISRTNQFKVPRTKNNEAIFRLSGNDKIVSTVPYSYLPCKLIESGVEVIPDAKLKLISTDKDSYTIQILENMADIFTQIRGKFLNELYTIPDSAWDAAGIDTARTNTSGIVSALMSWGKSGVVYQVNYFLPCFYYSTFVNKVLQSTGLTVTGSVLSGTDYTSLVIPYWGGSFTYPKNLVDDFYDKATGSGTTGGAGWGTQDIFVTTTQNGLWSISSDSYSLPLSTLSTANIDFAVTMSLTSVVWSAGTTAGRYWLELVRTRSGTPTTVYTTDGTSNVNYAATSGTITASATSVQVNYSTDTVKWVLKAAATGGTTSLNSASYSYSNSTATAQTTVTRTLVSWNALLKELDCTKLIEDFFNRFGIVPKQTGNTLELKTIQDILTDTSGSVDWSAKRVGYDENTNYSINYAISNNFDYTDSTLVNTPELGRGTITISNAIDKLRTLFQSVFETCVTLFFSGYNQLAQIPVYGTTSTGIDTFENPPGIKVLMTRARTTESSVTFNATARTDYRLAYFIDGTATSDAGFKYYLNKYYPLFTSAIQNTKIITRTYNLTELDIANFDPHKMIWDNGYFLVNKITNFVPGRLTTVELFKVN